ncbi:1581_t:CDS:2, partial [Gigaspora margarita]
MDRESFKVIVYNQKLSWYFHFIAGNGDYESLVAEALRSNWKITDGETVKSWENGQIMDSYVSLELFG